MQGYSGSYLKFQPAMSGVQIASLSSNPSNFAGYEFATLVVMTGSLGGSTAYTVTRSGTSGGTFATFGMSLVGLSGSAGSGKIITRSFTLDSSATWYRLVTDKNNTESANAQAMFVLSRPRIAPVPSQHADVTNYSDVLGG